MDLLWMNADLRLCRVGSDCFPLLSSFVFDPANDMRVLLIAVLALCLGACSLVFKLPTRQGNVMEQKQLDKLKIGMTRQQVTYLLGTPIAASPFRPDQWDYTGYYKSPRGELNMRTVNLYFDNDLLARIEGQAGKVGDVPVPTAKDAAAIYKEQKKEKNEDERAAEPSDSGVIITQPSNTP